jgi:mannosyltransferase OCH1-like enzyme
MKKKNKPYFICILLFIILLFIGINYMKTKEGFDTPKIPLHIYQTWRTKSLPPKMQECVDTLKQLNPEFQYHLFDDNDCADFIKNNFDEDVYDAFNTLIPGAYKADLWRYCILYKKGGIYLDIKFCNVNGFKFIDLVDKEYYVRDLDRSGGGVYNALLISKPGNKKLLKCIKQIVENVNNEFYGRSSLEPTGPLLLKKMFTEYELNNLELSVVGNGNNGSIIYKNNAILKTYEEYRAEQQKTNNTRYHSLWQSHNIYK